MNLSKEQITWVKENRDIILQIFEKFQEDVLDEMLSEEDDKKRETQRLWVKEMRNWIPLLRDIGKKNKATEKPYTGV
jgi:hypothetical protein